MNGIEICQAATGCRSLERAAIGGLTLESVRAVDRAIDILQAFANRPEGMKIADLEEETGIARPTLYRLVRTLERRRLLRTCGDPARYALDVGIVSLAQPWMQSLDLLPRAEAPLSALAEQVGETVALCVHRDNMRVFVREIVSGHALKYSLGVGATESVLRGAGGLAILAFEQQETIDSLLSTVDAKERGRLRKEIAAIRRHGCAVSEGQILDGATAIAAPVFNGTGQVFGSVGVYGPSARMAGEKIPEICAALLDCTRQISADTR